MRSNSLQYPNNSRFRFMEHDIVNLIVAMYERPSIFRLALLPREKGHHIVEMWYLPNGFFGVDVHSRSLSIGKILEKGCLAIVEAGGLAKGGEVDRGRGNAVEFGKRANCVVPPSIARCISNAQRGSQFSRIPHSELQRPRASSLACLPPTLGIPADVLKESSLPRHHRG